MYIVLSIQSILRFTLFMLTLDSQHPKCPKMEVSTSNHAFVQVCMYTYVYIFPNPLVELGFT